MDKEKFKTVQKKLADGDIPLYEARKAVCLPLSSKIPLGFVPPEAWSKFDLCKRQLSWYDSSEFAGKYLLISDRALTEYGIEIKPSTVIKKSKFKPTNLPKNDNSAINALVEKQVFQSTCPVAFKNLEAMEDGLQERWLKIMGIRGSTYRELFIVQCANHANFMDPDYFLESDQGIIPYSIGGTNKICSACLEFFNIIGGDFPKKYIVPCPGAVLFAGMAVNKYYEVITVTSD